MKHSRDTKSTLLRVLLYVFVILVVLITLYPYFVMFTTAAKSRAEIYATKGTLLLFYRRNLTSDPLALAELQGYLDTGSTFQIFHQLPGRCRWLHSDRDRMWYSCSLCTCTNEV